MAPILIRMVFRIRTQYYSLPATIASSFRNAYRIWALLGNELSPSVALCYTGKLVASAQLVDVLRVLCPTAFLFEPFRGSHCRASVTNGVTVQQTYELAVAMGLALRGGMEL